MNEFTPIKEFLRCQGEFMAYLMAILHDFDAAEEVFQNAAVVIVEGATAGEPIRNFRAWSKEIVRRQALYRLRKQKQESRLFRPIGPELFEALSAAFMEEDSEPGRRELPALRSCLQKLPPRSRELLTLRYERRNSFEEIGRATGSTPGAAQRALSRIRLLLLHCVRSALRAAQETT